MLLSVRNCFKMPSIISITNLCHHSPIPFLLFPLLSSRQQHNPHRETYFILFFEIILKVSSQHDCPYGVCCRNESFCFCNLRKFLISSHPEMQLYIWNNKTFNLFHFIAFKLKKSNHNRSSVDVQRENNKYWDNGILPLIEMTLAFLRQRRWFVKNKIQLKET